MSDTEDVPAILPNNELALVKQRLSCYTECIIGTRNFVQEITRSILGIEKAMATVSKHVNQLSDSEERAFENLKSCRVKIMRVFARSHGVVKDIEWLAERLLKKLSKVNAGDSQEKKEEKYAKAIDDFEENVKTRLEEVRNVCMEFDEISENGFEINTAIEKLKDSVRVKQIQLKTQIGSEITKTRICYITSGTAAVIVAYLAFNGYLKSIALNVLKSANLATAAESLVAAEDIQLEEATTKGTLFSQVAQGVFAAISASSLSYGIGEHLVVKDIQRQLKEGNKIIELIAEHITKFEEKYLEIKALIKVKKENMDEIKYQMQHCQADVRNVKDCNFDDEEIEDLKEHLKSLIAECQAYQRVKLEFDVSTDVKEIADSV
uniref:Uncharacterized protein n=1 Tax=Clytia hemisphaerica TaxID=252671 RepID=A0A7M5UI30_9CNID